MSRKGTKADALQRPPLGHAGVGVSGELCSVLLSPGILRNPEQGSRNCSQEHGRGETPTPTPNRQPPPGGGPAWVPQFLEQKRRAGSIDLLDISSPHSQSVYNNERGGSSLSNQGRNNSRGFIFFYKPQWYSIILPADNLPLFRQERRRREVCSGNPEAFPV